MRRGARRVRALALASHLGPTLAVTAFTTALAIGVGADVRTWVLVGAAMLAGQLSVGWSNDWVDAARDVAVARADKPVVRGELSVGAVRAAALLAAAACVPLSLATGWRAGLVHLVAVASAWGYNVRLKSTPVSWVPYALSFGLLPAFVTLALPGHPWPAPWAVAAAALLGVGAHLVNAVPDLEDDGSTGVRGLPHRLGRTWSSVLAPVALVPASALIVLGPATGGSGPGPGAWVGLLAATVLGVAAGVVALTRAHSRVPFSLAIAVAAVDVVLLVSAGRSLAA
ncbi:UbiA family prenyltransferase [Cellulomonas fimi]|uniref:UbiA family prenyltransferase n=1 Tax=Cellulomonas fimi TaxID=1708 RepID=A0A7Y0M0G5_CELFI|nr:UbiA family prenyltransferase [Cellulomonas fimi]